MSSGGGGAGGGALTGRSAAKAPEPANVAATPMAAAAINVRADAQTLIEETPRPQIPNASRALPYAHSPPHPPQRTVASGVGGRATAPRCLASRVPTAVTGP